MPLFVEEDKGFACVQNGLRFFNGQLNARKDDGPHDTNRSVVHSGGRLLQLRHLLFQLGRQGHLEGGGTQNGYGFAEEAHEGGVRPRLGQTQNGRDGNSLTQES